MALEDRKRGREETRRVLVPRELARALAVAALVAALVLGGLAWKGLHGKPTFEGEQRTMLGGTKVSLLPGMPRSRSGASRSTGRTTSGRRTSPTTGRARAASAPTSPWPSRRT